MPSNQKKPAKVFLMPPPVYHSCGSITISLPMPARAITPNAQRGQSRWGAIAKSRIIKDHRQTAMMAIREAMRCKPHCGQFKGYSYQHFFETMSFRDTDNANGGAKAYMDGSCDYLGVNDNIMEMVKVSTRQKDQNCPRIEITFYTQERLSADLKTLKHVCRKCGFAD